MRRGFRRKNRRSFGRRRRFGRGKRPMRRIKRRYRRLQFGGIGLF